MKRKEFIFGTMCIVLCFAISVTVLAVQSENRESGKYEKPILGGNGVVNKELSVELFHSDRSVTVYDIKELTRRSTDIIIGRPLMNNSVFIKGDSLEDVHTSHTMLVQAVFKGTVEAGSKIILRIPEGAFVGSDDKYVRLLASDARPLREEASYFIFMKKFNEKVEYIYVPALGIQSLFEIDDETNTIIPCDTLRSSPVVQKYLHAPVTAFMEEILSLVSTEIRRQ
jgi:hypothetical protein